VYQLWKHAEVRGPTSKTLVGTEVRGERSAPLPQLFPRLNKRLYLSWSREAAINEAAILVRLLVEIADCWQAEMRETVTEFCKFFLAQHLRFAAVGSSGHQERNSTSFVLYSPQPK
jgi:hypothetical protein